MKRINMKRINLIDNLIDMFFFISIGLYAGQSESIRPILLQALVDANTSPDMAVYSFGMVYFFYNLTFILLDKYYFKEKTI